MASNLDAGRSCPYPTDLPEETDKKGGDFVKNLQHAIDAPRDRVELVGDIAQLPCQSFKKPSLITSGDAVA